MINHSVASHIAASGYRLCLVIPQTPVQISPTRPATLTEVSVALLSTSKQTSSQNLKLGQDHFL
jgi:hypothetical protein